MAYKPAEILNKCPETVRLKSKDIKIYEWTISEFKSRVSFYCILFDTLKKKEILEYSKNEEKLKTYLKGIYYTEPSVINKLINQLYPDIKININIVSSAYVDILFICNKQNKILNLLAKEKIISELDDLIELDEYDNLTKIISLNLWKDLSFSNYEDLLTYSQYKFLLDKVLNFEKNIMINQYRPLRHVLSEVFAGKESNIKPFFETLYVRDSAALQFKRNKRSYFHEKWEDNEFIFNACKEKGLDPTLFFPKEDIPEGFEKYFW